MTSTINNNSNSAVISVSPSQIQSLNEMFLIKKGFKIDVGVKENKPKPNMVHIEEKVKLQNENHELRKKVSELQRLLQENRQSYLLVS